MPAEGPPGRAALQPSAPGPPRPAVPAGAVLRVQPCLARSVFPREAELGFLWVPPGSANNGQCGSGCTCGGRAASPNCPSRAPAPFAGVSVTGHSADVPEAWLCWRPQGISRLGGKASGQRMRQAGSVLKKETVGPGRPSKQCSRPRGQRGCRQSGRRGGPEAAGRAQGLQALGVRFSLACEAELGRAPREGCELTWVSAAPSGCPEG